MSDRIAVMHAGRVVGVVDRAAATQESILALALGHPLAAGPAAREDAR
jgi:ABC-type sugar transport system ATPase subunit